MSCNSFNVISVLICSGCLEEYIGETGVGKTRLRDRVRVYRQHLKQSEHQKLRNIFKFAEEVLSKYSPFFRCDQMTQM